MNAPEGPLVAVTGPSHIPRRAVEQLAEWCEEKAEACAQHADSEDLRIGIGIGLRRAAEHIRFELGEDNG